MHCVLPLFSSKRYLFGKDYERGHSHRESSSGRCSSNSRWPQQSHDDNDGTVTVQKSEQRTLCLAVAQIHQNISIITWFYSQKDVNRGEEIVLLTDGTLGMLLLCPSITISLFTAHSHVIYTLPTHKHTAIYLLTTLSSSPSSVQFTRIPTVWRFWCRTFSLRNSFLTIYEKVKQR